MLLFNSGVFYRPVSEIRRKAQDWKHGGENRRIAVTGGAEEDPSSMEGGKSVQAGFKVIRENNYRQKAEESHE